jgi:tetratricopeptide (TPR) repeat protein
MRRAGQLVSERRLAEAEVEIVEALAEVPDDLRAHKLLALVRFRLGRLVDARTSYRRVVEAAPDDAPARLNLGLIALKLERYAEAAEELETAVRLRPDDARALGYLGHAYVRLGRARDAARVFRQAGQPELATEVENRAGRAPAAAAGKVDFASPFDAREQAAPAAAAAAGAGAAGQALGAFVHGRLIDPTAASSGVYRLVLDEGQAYVQAATLLAAVGEVAVDPARRRQRGQQTAAPLAGDGSPFLFCRGRGELWLTGNRLDVLTLEEDVLFVRQGSVLAFSGDLVWDAGAIPRSNVRLLHLHGSGRVVVDWSGRDLVAVRLSEGQPLTAALDRLCGWIGNVVVHLTDPPGAEAPLVACEGEGVLLIGRHGQAGERVYQPPEPGHHGAGRPHPRGAAVHR